MYWMGGMEKYEGVGAFVAERWVDNIVRVNRMSERLVLKLVLHDRSANVFSVCASHSGKSEER